MSVDFLAEKFDVVSNDHGCQQKNYFPVLDRKYPLWTSLVQKK